MTEKQTRWMLRILSLFFLGATFEHNFSTLRNYSSELMLWGLDIAVLSKVVLVAGIDLASYFAIQYIISQRGTNKDIMPAKLMLVLAGVVSGSLNVYYMVKFAPADAYAEQIGIVVGLLIQVMIVLLGWIGGDTRDKITAVDKLPAVEKQIQAVVKKKRKPAKTKGPSATEQRIVAELKLNPLHSDRKIAAKLKCSHTTVSKYRKRYGIYDK